MSISYIGIGSNLSDPAKQVQLAISAIKDIAQCEIQKISSLYYSRPMGPQDQPDYMNAVIKIDTSLTAIALLDALQKIENDAGRVRKDKRWGARILDLDILLYDNKIISNERLTVPHYGLKLREFVLIPLAEISPYLILPDGDSISMLSAIIDPNGLKIHQTKLTS